MNLKSLVTLVVLAMSISSCDSNALEDNHGTRLVRAEFTGKYGDQWEERYSYDEEDKLIEIVSTHSLGERLVFNYVDSRLDHFFTYQLDTERVIFKDSIQYNAAGAIEKLLFYDTNSAGQFQIRSISEYTYDSAGVLVQRGIKHEENSDFRRVEKYFWDGPNIVRVEHHVDDEFRYEYFYEYDDKSSYEKLNPNTISNPLNWSANNIPTERWNDYHGNLDKLCNPCTASYQYNYAGMPIWVTTNWGREIRLRYISE